MIYLLSAELLEEFIAGKPDFDPEYFFTRICYSGFGKDEDMMIWLREIIKEWSAEMRTRYIRFCWGRSRLPDPKFDCSHYIYKNYASDPDRRLPNAGTCGFSITYPNYSSKEILKQKLEYAIVFCNEIDSDFGAAAANIVIEHEDLIEVIQRVENLELAGTLPLTSEARVQLNTANTNLVSQSYVDEESDGGIDLFG